MNDKEIQKPVTQTGTPQEKASVEPGKEEPAIDPAKEYLVGKDKTPMLGADILNALGRAKLVSQVQSEKDKMQAQLAQMDQILQERDQLKQKVEEAQRKQQLEDLLKSRLPKATKKQEEDDFWSADDETTPQIDERKIAETIRLTAEEAAKKETAQRTQNIDSLVEQKVNERMRQMLEQQAMTQRASSFDNEMRQVQIDDYTSNYGLSEQEARKLVDMQARAKLRFLESEDKYKSGDFESASEAYSEARAIDHSVTTQLADSLAKHREATQREELEKQVESGSFPDIPPPTKEPDDKFLFWRDRRAREAKKQADLDRAIAQAEAKQRANQMLGK